MFSEYVVRAVVAEHVEQLRREAVADRLVRSTDAARSHSHRVISGRLAGRPARTLAAALSLGTARPGGSVLPSGPALPDSAARPQPCGC